MTRLRRRSTSSRLLELRSIRSMSGEQAFLGTTRPRILLIRQSHLRLNCLDHLQESLQTPRMRSRAGLPVGCRMRARQKIPAIRRWTCWRPRPAAAFYNQNDLSRIIGKVTGGSEDFYTVSYTPTNSKMDGSFRKIEVKSGDSNQYTLSHRGGYVARDEDLPRAAQLRQDRPRSNLRTTRPNSIRWGRL